MRRKQLEIRYPSNPEEERGQRLWIELVIDFRTNPEFHQFY
jgi:hypothetical protein